MNTFGTSCKWLIGRQPNPKAQLRLFCFPYAGASAYREWEPAFPSSVQLCRIQLPGREERLRDRPFTNFSEVTRALVRDLADWLDTPFMVFGHSMGALLAFEFARELRRVGGPRPEHLFLSGRQAPHLKSRIPQLHDLPEAEFKRQLGLLNGTPKKVLEDPELMGLLMPMLRADFSICETYSCTPEEPLSLPISAFGGEMDPHTRRDDLDAWRNYTLGNFNVRMFSGDHFYIQSMRSSLLSAILEVTSVHIFHTARLSILQRNS